MTTQEQFEADYLAAFPNSKRVLISDDPGAPAIVISPRTALAIWFQQRKRHEAEVAELVAALKGIRDLMGYEWLRDEFVTAQDVIAKFEVKS